MPVVNRSDHPKHRPFPRNPGRHQVNNPLMGPTVALDLRIVVNTMVAMVVLLTLGHVMTILVPLLNGSAPSEGAHQFDLGRENNLATWYASTALILCAGLLGLIGTAKHLERDRFRWHWLALAGGFVLLSIDEAASLHELLGRTIESRIHLTGYLYYGSIPPLLFCVGLVAAGFAQFLFHLPPRTRGVVMLAGLLYVGGAVGFEMLEAREEFTMNTQATAAYHLMVYLEEILEMTGAVVFFYALGRYVRETWGGMQLRIGGTSR